MSMLSQHGCSNNCGGVCLDSLNTNMTLDAKDIKVTITEERVKDSVALLKELMRSSAIGLKAPQRVAGKSGFIASLVPHFNPFLVSFWGAIATIKNQEMMSNLTTTISIN